MRVVQGVPAWGRKGPVSFPEFLDIGDCFNHNGMVRSNQPENAGSRPISEAKLAWARLVVR
jgi:hypothetical protein